MKFEFRDGLIFAPITVVYNNTEKTFNALIDTGSAGTAIDSGIFKLDLQRDGIIKDIVGIGGKQQVLVQIVEDISFVGVRVENFPIEFADLKDSFGVNAFIGTDFLKKIKAVIDYSTDEIRSLLKR